MADQEDGFDSSGPEFEEEFRDQIGVSLLPRANSESERKRIFRCFTFNRKTVIVGVVAVVLLLVIVLLAVYIRPASVQKVSNKKVNHQATNSLRLPRHLSPIEYRVYLHPNLTTFNFSGKVDILLYCNEAANNITLHIGKKVYYSSVQVSFVPDANDKKSTKPLGFTKISRLPGEMICIKLDSKLKRGKYYFLAIEFDSELSRGLAGFYLSTYKSSSGEIR